MSGIRKLDLVPGALLTAVFAAAVVTYISFPRTTASAGTDSAALAEFVVDNENDSGPGSLRDAIARANASPGFDSIVFNFLFVNTIRLTSGQIEITSPVFIAPNAPGTGITISGNNSSRIFNIVGVAATIQGVTLTQGNSGALEGGAINVTGGSLTLERVILDNNRSSSDGGAVSATEGSNLTFTNCRFANNIAGAGASGSGGGGAFVAGFGVNVTVTETTFEGNQARGNPVPGGAGWMQGGGILTVRRSAFIANIADDGSAILDSGGTVLSEGNTYRGNISRRTGAIFTFGNLVSKVDTFDGNSAAAGGIAIQNAGPGTATLNGTTVTGNTTGGSATEGASTGAIRAAGGTTILQNVLLAQNNGPDLSGTFVSQGYNLIQNPGTAIITGNTSTNITGQNPMLGPLQNNGGPTQTRALLPGSPAIDKGFSPADVTADQRGFPRPVDNPGIPNAAGGNGTDIGAFEVQAGTPTPTPTATPTPAPTPSPTPTPAPGGLEGDLAPRPTGDGEFRANDLAALQLFFAGTPFAQGSNEFQRADGAPFETRGDGRLTAADVQLMRNYIAQLAVPQAAGGPTEPLPARSIDAELVITTIDLNSRGDKTAATLTGRERAHLSSWIWSKPAFPFIALR